MRFSPIFIRRLYRTGLLLVLILLIADLLAFFYYPETVFGDIFLATREQTPLTWISSLTMLFIALSCFSCYLETKKKIWYFLSFTFFFFSMDDAVYFHERVSGFFIDNTTFLSFFPSYIWVLLYFPLLIFSLAAFIYLLWKDTKKQNKKIILTSLFILGFAIFLDLLDGFMQKNSSVVFCHSEFCNATSFHFIRLTEEVLEVIALGMLGYTNIKRHCLLQKNLINK